MMSKKTILVLVLAIFLMGISSGCAARKDGKEVVIYTSVDQMYAEAILKEFENKTGIRVKPVYDVEATKTTGLVQRLIAEKQHPRADVFWSGEIVKTIQLQEAGVLQPYDSPSAADIPALFRDADNYWTGYAGRARIIIVNTNLVRPEEYPRSVNDLLSPAWPGEKLGIALPMFGTTVTHATALYTAMGPEQGKEYFQGLSQRGVSVVDGNSVVKDMVARGELLFGLTDTDDACKAMAEGYPVDIVFLDQGTGEMGTFVIPNTVAMVAGAPNPEEAAVLIDYLLSLENERRLVEIGWCHFPVRPVDIEQKCIDVTGVRQMAADYEEIYRQLEHVTVEMRELFIN